MNISAFKVITSNNLLGSNIHSHSEGRHDISSETLLGVPIIQTVTYHTAGVVTVIMAAVKTTQPTEILQVFTFFPAKLYNHK